MGQNQGLALALALALALLSIHVKRSGASGLCVGKARAGLLATYPRSLLLLLAGQRVAKWISYEACNTRRSHHGGSERSHVRFHFHLHSESASQRRSLSWAVGSGLCSMSKRGEWGRMGRTGTMPCCPCNQGDQGKG